MNKNNKNFNSTDKKVDPKGRLKLISIPICIGGGIIIGVITHNLTLWLCIGVAIGAGFMVIRPYQK